MLPDLTRITHKASTDPTCRFTALAHYLNEEFLLDTWLRLNRRGSAGIDRQTRQDFDAQRETAIRGLVDRSRRHAYQGAPGAAGLYSETRATGQTASARDTDGR